MIYQQHPITRWLKKNIPTPSSKPKTDTGTSESKSQPSTKLGLDGQSLSVKPIDLPKAVSKKSLELDGHIQSISKKWNESEGVLKQQQLELSNFENQINNPNVPQDVKNLLIPEYNSLLENSKVSQQEFDKIKSSAIELQQAKATLGKIDKVQKELEAKSTSMASDVYESLKRGSSSLGAMIARTPGFIYDAAAMPQNALAKLAPETFGNLNVSHQSFAENMGLPDNKVAEFYEKAAKESQEKIALKYDKAVSDYFANGEIEKGFGLLANQVAESAPVSLSLMVGGIGGLGAKSITFGGGAVFAAGKKQELDEANPDMDEFTKTFNASATGVLEGVFNNIGITKLGGFVAGILKNEGKDIAVDVAKKGFKEVFLPTLTKYTGVVAEEIIGEGATQFSQNVVDKYTGAKPDINLMEGVTDAMLVGLGSSIASSTPVAAADVTKNVLSKKQSAAQITDETNIQPIVEPIAPQPETQAEETPVVNTEQEAVTEEQVNPEPPIVVKPEEETVTVETPKAEEPISTETPPEILGATPNQSTEKRVKALSKELSESETIPKELQDKIKLKGIEGDVFGHDEAKAIADNVIKKLSGGNEDTEAGVEEALKIADEQLKGSVKAFVYGKAVDFYAKKIDEATTPEEKDRLSDLGAAAAEKFEADAEAYGRFISAIGKYYQNHPDIVTKRAIKKLAVSAAKVVAGKSATTKKIDAVLKELEDLKNTFDDKVEEKVQKKSTEISSRLFGKEAVKKVDDAADAIIAKIKSGTFVSLIPPPVLIGSVNATRFALKTGMELANAIQIGVQYIKDNYKGAFDEQSIVDEFTKSFDGKTLSKKSPKSDINKKIARFGKLLSKAIPKKGETAKEAEIRKNKEIKSLAAELDAASGTKGYSDMADEYLDMSAEDKIKKEQLAILNKYFPKKRTESDTKRKAEHEKIIEQYNAGLFEGKVNKDGIPFESLFYEKLGIVNPNSAEVKAKIKGFADKIAKAPEGSNMWREANQDMMNYLANLAYQTKLRSGASKIDAMWYANILSSPATHARNMQYNIIQSMIAQPLLLIQKAALKGDYKAASTIYANVIKGLQKGYVEAGRVMKTGKSSRFDVVGAQPITDRGGDLMKFFAVPGRALKASDILMTDVAYQTKMSEFARNMVKADNPNLSNDEVNAKVNDMIGNTKERKEAATEQAEKELEHFYGPDWKNIKDIETIQKIREYEIIDLSMPKELKDKHDEAVTWSKRSLLTNKPTGIYGKASDIIQSMNDATWFTKFAMPFVNVPLNVAQTLVDKSPVGIAKVIRGKEGWGSYETELTPDQRLELTLKIINYAIIGTLLMTANGDNDDDWLVITGEQTGNYTDNKGINRGGKLRPYTVNVFGKEILSYKQTPWAAVFLPAGFVRDAKVYKESKSVLEAIPGMAMNYLLFVNETSAMQGVQGIFETLSEMKKGGSNMTEKLFTNPLAKLLNGMVPYSGAVKYVANTTNAVIGKADKRPIDFMEIVFRDIPFLTTSQRTRMDAFGQPQREIFDMPMIPIGDRGWMGELSEKSPYYKLTSDHKYFPQFSFNRKFYVKGQEIEISKKELDDLNIRRGTIVREVLDGKNMFVSKAEAEASWAAPIGKEPKPSKESKMTTKEYLDGLDDKQFKERMDKIFEHATRRARLEKFGVSLGIKKDEVEKFLNMTKVMQRSGLDISDEEMSKIKANKKDMIKFIEEKGVGKIEVDSY